MPAPAAALSTGTLRRFSPFNALDESLLDTFIEYCEVHSAEAGTALFRLGDQDTDDFFLLKGSVQLITAQRRESFIEAGLPNSNHALSRSRPRQQHAIAHTDIIYFVMNNAVLAELNRNSQGAKDYLSIMAMGNPVDDDGDALLHQFQHDLNRGNFSLPSFPDVALQINRLVDDPECNIDAVVKLIHSDPGIAAKIIQTANSALYRGVANCENINQAVMRLGLMTTKQLVISFALLGLYDTDSAMLKQQMQLLRKQSVRVAAYNFILAKHFPALNAEEAMLAGLLHQLGDIVVLSYAERFHEFDSNPMQLAVVMKRLASSAGTLAVEEWGFPESLINVVREADQWLNPSQGHFNYVDLTLVSKYLCLMDIKENSAFAERSAVPSLQKALALQPASALHNIVQDNQQAIDDMQAVFS